MRKPCRWWPFASVGLLGSINSRQLNNYQIGAEEMKNELIDPSIQKNWPGELQGIFSLEKRNSIPNIETRTHLSER